MNSGTNNLLRALCTGPLSLGGLAFTPVAWATDPRCGIASINANGRVTAKELAGKQVFQFQVTNQAILRSLRVGQQVHTDFTAMKVSVQPDGGAPCCQIVQAAGGAAVKSGQTISGQWSGDPIPTESVRSRLAIPAGEMPTVMAGDPCCAIAANFDARSDGWQTPRAVQRTRDGRSWRGHDIRAPDLSDKRRQHPRAR